MTRTLTKSDQKLLDQAIQEVQTGMLASKVLAEAQVMAGGADDLDRAYIKLRFRQLRRESARQMQKVVRMREQAGALADDGMREARARRAAVHAGTLADSTRIDEDGIRLSRRRQHKSRKNALVMTALILGFFFAVGLGLYHAL